ncbi:MAG: glycosyltransferase family 2 protein [Flavobacteriaceae bacterium]|nr:glycosyltransferase family 2 protein [Flavobacteriaceae bacterium]
MNNTLTVIIVNYKSWDKLTYCLESIKNQANIVLNVIVVDNFSNDTIICDFKNKFKWVKWIENKTNLGFAKACNIGAKNSNSNWLLFLNPDTIIKKNNLSSLIKFCDKNQNHRIIGIKQLNKKNKPSNSFGLFLNIWSINSFFRIFSRIVKNQTYNRINRESISNPDWISGSFILIRMIDFIKLNGWNENYWMYYEDMDLCKRANNLKLRVSILNNWECTHFHGVSSRINKKIKVKTKAEVLKSSHIYVNTHFKGVYNSLLHISLFFSNLIRLIILSFFSSTMRSVLKLYLTTLIKLSKW